MLLHAVSDDDMQLSAEDLAHILSSKVRLMTLSVNTGPPGLPGT